MRRRPTFTGAAPQWALLVCGVALVMALAMTAVPVDAASDREAREIVTRETELVDLRGTAGRVHSGVASDKVMNANSSVGADGDEDGSSVAAPLQVEDDLVSGKRSLPAKAAGPLTERVLVLSNLNGDILRFKTELVLSGIAELVAEQPIPAATTTTTATTPAPDQGIVAKAKDSSDDDSLLPLTAATSAAAVSFVVSPRLGETPSQVDARDALIRRQQRRLVHLSEGRLRLTDHCFHTAVVLLGNSVGDHPHSHEILDTFAQLRREGLETKVDCRFYLVAGPNEIDFLTGQFTHLTSTGSPEKAKDGKRPGGRGGLRVASAPHIPSVVEMRQRQQQRRVLVAFQDSMDVYKESYSPYGAYGRFLLSSSLYVLCFGDTVLSHGGITAAYAAMGTRGINAKLFEDFKSSYNRAGMSPRHSGHESVVYRPAQPLQAETLSTEEEEERGGSTGGGSFVLAHGSPLNDQSLVLAAALDNNCDPVRQSLRLLSQTEEAPVRRMVVASSADTTAAVKERFHSAKSPLAAPVSMLCDGSLIVVSGSDRAESPLSFLRLRHSTDDPTAEPWFAAFTAHVQYPVGTRAVPLFVHRRQPIAQPQWGRSVQTATPTPNDEESEDEEVSSTSQGAEQGTSRLAKQLHVPIDAAAAAATVMMNDGKAGALPRPDMERSPLPAFTGAATAAAGARGAADGGAAAAAAGNPSATSEENTAANENLRLRMRQRKKTRKSTERGGPWRSVGVKVALITLAVLTAACVCLSRTRWFVRVSFLRFHDKSQ